MIGRFIFKLSKSETYKILPYSLLNNSMNGCKLHASRWAKIFLKNQNFEKKSTKIQVQIYMFCAINVFIDLQYLSLHFYCVTNGVRAIFAYFDLFFGNLF
jgi:hypothetical protein